MNIKSQTLKPAFGIILGCMMLFSQGLFAQGGTPITTILKATYTGSTPQITYDFTPDTWYYVAFTKQVNGKGGVFVDGDSIAELSWDPVVYDHYILNIGAAYFPVYRDFFEGSIDEIRISSKIRTAAEMKSHFLADSPFQKDASTLQIWAFDEGAGNQFFNADNDLTGTLYGTPAWVDGKFGKAVQYDGIDDRGRLNYDMPESGVTYEFWVRFDYNTNDTPQVILQAYGSNHLEFSIQKTNIPPPPVGTPPTFFAADGNPAAGDTLVVPIKVKDFKDILTAQYTLTWDPAVLQFIKVQDFALRDLDATSFNLFGPGQLTSSWTPADATPETVTDSTTIFNLVLKAVGNQGDESTVAFGDTPTPREVGNNSGVITGVTWIEGNISILQQVTLGGMIGTQNGTPLPNVPVSLSGGGTSISTMTDGQGKYSFTVNPGILYRILPSLDTIADQSVTTLDLVIMQWHILGMKDFMSNYDKIASDVNDSKSLTTLDVAETRAVILHIKEMFEKGRAIEFVNHEYTGVPDVFDYLSYLDIQPTASQNDLDFIAVKVGDAGQTWSSAGAAGGRTRSLKNLNLQIEKGNIDGKNLNVPISAMDFEHIVGLQFTLEWDPSAVQFNRINDELISLHANIENVANGQLTALWNSETREGITAMKKAFSSFDFTILDGQKDPNIHVSSAITPALAFDADLNTLGINTKALSGKNGNLILYPNPAENTLQLAGLNNEKVNYEIRNASGALVGKGQLQDRHDIDIQSLDAGVYVLKVKGRDISMTQKFIKH